MAGIKVDHDEQLLSFQPDTRVLNANAAASLSLQRLAQQIGEATGVQAAAELLLKGLSAVFDLNWVLIVRAGYDHWSLAAVAGHPPDHVLTPFKTGLSYSEGVMGQAIQHNKAIYVPRYDLEMFAVHETAMHFSGACAYLPLCGANGLPWGGMFLASEASREAWELDLRETLEGFTKQLSGVLERATLVGHSVAAVAIARLSEEALSPSGVLIRAGQAVAATTQIDSLGLFQVTSGDAPRLLSTWKAHGSSASTEARLMQAVAQESGSINWDPDRPAEPQESVE